jgi:hypothetical protein
LRPKKEILMMRKYQLLEIRETPEISSRNPPVIIIDLLLMMMKLMMILKTLLTLMTVKL